MAPRAGADIKAQAPKTTAPHGLSWDAASRSHSAWEARAAQEGRGVGLPGYVAGLQEALCGWVGGVSEAGPAPLAWPPRSARQLPRRRHQMAADALRSRLWEGEHGGVGAPTCGGHLRRDLRNQTTSSGRPRGLRGPRPLARAARECALTPFQVLPPPPHAVRARTC